MEVKELLEAHCITQAKLAKKIGMYESDMSRKLNGKKEFRQSDLKKIFIQTKATPEEIVEVMLG